MWSKELRTARMPMEVHGKNPISIFSSYKLHKSYFFWFQNILSASEFFSVFCCRLINSLNLSRCNLVFHRLVVRDLSFLQISQSKQNIQSFNLFPWIIGFCLLKKKKKGGHILNISYPGQIGDFLVYHEY